MTLEGSSTDSQLEEQRQYSQQQYLLQEYSHVFSATTLLNASVACIAAAVLTYPAESRRVEWERTALKFWDPEQHLEEMNVKQRNFRALTPLVRLVSNELAGTLLTEVITPNETKQNRGTWYYDVMAGAIAGVCQTLLLTPLEAWKASQIMYQEQQLSNQWKYWLHSQILKGGSVEPEERRLRAFRGVGITAAREVVFNVTFFPLFHMFQRYSMPQPTERVAEKLMNLTFSGIAAGMICSLTVTPMDILICHMKYSRERWSLWSGKKIHAAPLALLSRGLVLQAFCFGPAFGVVAAIYELT